ncbi:MAG: Gfo/Idh/MocA family oxidoreductase [Kiritimatiellaeota bacterium]|nr:Gfo/Idh/MocA family oxidoreductase [Kiritimatiellota bacterium]
MKNNSIQPALDETGSQVLARRDFLRSSAAMGAGLLVAPAVLGQGRGKLEDLHLAMIGVGAQGRVLLRDSLKVPGVRFVAICDIWHYHQRYAANILKKYGQPVNVYSDYREMLDKEKSIDAVLIASPDWMHAEHTIACLKAGKHVYCEKEMSNSLELAKQMVLAARQTGKLLQIGHQRRSNPRYTHALRLVEKDKLLGRITHVYGQWNRVRRQESGWPKGREMDAATLKRFGYDTMYRFRNWRNFHKFSGGPIADLGSHQIDVFNWFLRTDPRAVMASGGRDYYKKGDWYDNVMALFEYNTPPGTVRGFYQVLNTTSYGGYYETFMGDEGTLVISEDPRKGFIFREVVAKHRQWEDEADKIESMGREAIELKIGESRRKHGKAGQAKKLEDQLKKKIHQLHLENFYNAVRKGTPLSCPGEIGYETAVTVLKVNEAVVAARRLTYDPKSFTV